MNQGVRSCVLRLVLVGACMDAGSKAAAAQQVEQVASAGRAPQFLLEASPGPRRLDVRRTPALTRRISVDFDNTTLDEALAIVAQQSGIRLLYSDATIPLAKRVTFRAGNVTVASVMTELLVDTDVDVLFQRNGRVVLVRRRADVMAELQGIVSGKVIDSVTTEGVAGVTVLVEGTRVQTTTSPGGTYTLRSVPVGQRSILARRLGYKTQSRRVIVSDTATAVADFTLVRAPTLLSEMVVTPTGDRQRLEVGNAIGTIRADSVVPVTLIRNVSDLLMARTPGVVVSNSTGAVGAPSKVRVRGVNSIQLNNDPIVILDGARLNAQVTFAKSQMNTGAAEMLVPSYPASDGGTTSAAPSRIDDIDPNTIESIDILRGPSAASLYGTEAANGVIVIKTKQGSLGPIRYNVLADNGWSYIPGKMPDAWFGWGRNANGTPNLGYCSLDLVAAGSCAQDSVSHFNPANDPDMTTLGLGNARNLSTSLSGGTEQLREFLSFRISNNVGVTKLSNAEQRRLTRMWGTAPPAWMRRPNTSFDVNTSSRTNVKMGSKMDVSFSANGVYRNVINGGSGVPQTNLANGVGYGNLTARGPWDTLAYLPAEAQRTRQSSLVKRGYLSLNGNYLASSWLTFRATLGGDYTLRTDEALQRLTECTALLTPSGCASGRVSDRGETFVTTMDLGAHVSVSPTSWLTARSAIGEQYRDTKYYGLMAGNNYYTSLAFGTELLSPSPVPGVYNTRYYGGELYTVNERRDESATAGWYIEQTAALRERLFLTAAVRQDAASAFGPSINKNHLPIYPKFSLSWLISDESFFPRQSFVSSLRLRSAYGHSGNQATQQDVLGNYIQGSARVRGVTVPAVIQSQVGNPDLKPERSKEWEGGFDLALLEGDRLRVEATLYQKQSQDAITQIQLPGSYGTAQNFTGSYNLSQRINLGSVENRGWELSVGARPVDGRRFAWDLNVNMTRNTNKLVSLSPSGLFYGGAGQFVGYPIFGVFVSTICSFADTDGDGILSPNEVVWCTGSPGIPNGYVFKGAPYPKSEVTWDNNFTFLSGALRLGTKVDQVNRKLTNLYRFSGIGNRCVYDRSCSLAQQAAMLEAARSVQSAVSRVVSSVRLSELAVTYNLSGATASRLVRVRSASVTLAGRNLGLWTDYAGKDPNIDDYGALSEDNIWADLGWAYPQPRNWTIRVNLGF